MGHHFKQFYFRQLKNGQLDEMSAKSQKCKQNVFLYVMLIRIG